jgi:Cdc6-like AAA superfamily ATPase
MPAEYRISSVTPSTITIDVLDHDAFKTAYPQPLTIGTYLRISDDNDLAIIAIVRSYTIKDHDAGATATLPTTGFTIAAQPVGYLDAQGKFRRGGQHIAIPPTRITIADNALLKTIYEPQDDKRTYSFGTLAQHNGITVKLNGDRFFGKHLAVIGSTGSGKSCTVAKILQEATKPSAQQVGILNNAHIIIFDLHGEYHKAFPNANYLPADPAIPQPTQETRTNPE